MGESPIEDFFEQYEDVALAVVSAEQPNIHVGTQMSNADMAETVCQIMDWEWFNLFDEYDYELVYKSGTPPMLMAFCYIAFLRWKLWETALQNSVGDKGFNEKACAYDQSWYLRLRDRYTAVVTGKETEHRWLH